MTEGGFKMVEHLVFEEHDIQDNKVIAALSYLGLLVLVPLLAKKDSLFCQFHAKQGLVLLIAWVIIGAVAVIPILGWIIGIVGSIFLFVCFIMGLVNALSGQAGELPLIGQYASYFNL
jgi:uncharacterized membrane protein